MGYWKLGLAPKNPTARSRGSVKKVAGYETVGIPEYWIVDYAALGGRRVIGNPKQATISVYSLVDGEYQVRQFRSSDRIISPTFPELNLTAEQIFQAGGVQGT